MSASVFVSIVALFFSGFALVNSMKQRKIASESHRLSLYQYRFHAFDQAISFFRRFSHGHMEGRRWARSKYEEEALAFTSAVNEAGFLFNPYDGVVDSMQGLIAQADLINNGRETDLATLETHVQAISSKMAPYLNFHELSADDSSESSCFLHSMKKKALAFIKSKWN